MESVHQLMLDDEIPENERARLDPDHWYEINLTNAVLFSNLYLEHVAGLEQLVPGRLFSTRMPRNIVEDLGEREDFIKRCRVNKLRVVFVLTESHEFKKYSGMDGLLEFYKQECGLIVYNRAIPDFQIPDPGRPCEQHPGPGLSPLQGPQLPGPLRRGNWQDWHGAGGHRPEPRGVRPRHQNQKGETEENIVIV